jgi:hypothetical protein
MWCPYKIRAPLEIMASRPGHPFISPLFPPTFLPPLHIAYAVGTANARPVFGAIDIGAYEFTP